MHDDWARTHINMGFGYLGHVPEDRCTSLTKAKGAMGNFFEVISLEMDPFMFLKGWLYRTELYFQIGSMSEGAASCKHGLQALSYAKTLSSAGLLHSK